MNAFVKFHKGLFRQPLHVKLWLKLLVAVNMGVPLFYLKQLEAQAVLGAFVAGFLSMILLTGISGFSRLLGLGHIFWFPLLCFLWVRLDLHPAGEFFSLWIRAVIVLNAISLVIDVVDVIRYIGGDREETVPGL